MGSKQTKIEGSYLPSTPTKQYSPYENMNMNSENSTLDPRSPAECRTPIYLQNKRVATKVRENSIDIHERESNNHQSTLGFVRKRFFKSFTYNFYDPRSPSTNFNRTPLVFEDTLEKSLSLNDTFADLFVETRLLETCNKLEPSAEIDDEKSEQVADVEVPKEKVIKCLEEPSTTPKTPIALQQVFDPRSPSVGVERTPIIFSDDEIDETNEDIILESILATLSLNLDTSGNSSVVSMPIRNANLKNIQSKFALKPMNKHLDRVRAGKKNYSKSNHSKSKQRPSHQQIYEDHENHAPMTPKLKASQTGKDDSMTSKRTPLSCVRNRNSTQSRSRSVESSAISIKTRLALTSFDDSLNPIENEKVRNLSIILKGSQNSMEL